MTAKPQPFVLAVARKDFASALMTAATGLRGDEHSRIRLSLADGWLDVRGPGASETLPAAGTWPAAVLVDSGVLRHLATRLPQQEPLVLRVENSRLHVGTFAIDAAVYDIAPEAIQLPLLAPLAEILVEIERSGLPKVLASVGPSAVDEANSDLAVRVREAARLLVSYGVTENAIAALTRAAVRRKAGKE
jgi:hypothetical protein